MRILFRKMFAKLQQKNWNELELKKYIDFLKSTMISVETKICESLKCHTASIYLDELDNAGIF